MNEFKGTPGPLHVYPSSAHAETDFAVESDEDGGIAWVVKEADATLFAAAPDLLEALHGMLLHIREPESESEFQWPHHFKKQKDAFSAARAAIAKALGK